MEKVFVHLKLSHKNNFRSQVNLYFHFFLRSLSQLSVTTSISASSPSLLLDVKWSSSPWISVSPVEEMILLGIVVPLVVCLHFMRRFWLKRKNNFIAGRKNLSKQTKSHLEPNFDLSVFKTKASSELLPIRLRNIFLELKLPFKAFSLKIAEHSSTPRPFSFNVCCAV